MTQFSGVCQGCAVHSGDKQPIRRPTAAAPFMFPSSVQGVPPQMIVSDTSAAYVRGLCCSAGTGPWSTLLGTVTWNPHAPPPRHRLATPDH